MLRRFVRTYSISVHTVTFGSSIFRNCLFTSVHLNLRRCGYQAFGQKQALQILAVSLSVGLAQSFCQSHKYYAEKKPLSYKLSLCLCEPPLCTSFAVLRTRVVYLNACCWYRRLRSLFFMMTSLQRPASHKWVLYQNSKTFWTSFSQH